jgi:hypothetical protein
MKWTRKEDAQKERGCREGNAMNKKPSLLGFVFVFAGPGGANKILATVWILLRDPR